MKCIDFFCGVGGFSLAAQMAGASVVLAANHDQFAVDAHAANHPGTAHICADLTDMVDFSALPGFDVLLGAPACQGHSQAAQPSRKKSGRVRGYHDSLRATAWAIANCADVCEPRAIIVENVLDFARWRQFDPWCDALRACGYRLYMKPLTSSVHADVPQRRQRLFIVAIRGRKKRGEEHVLDLPETPEPAFGPHIDWDDGRWSLVSGATPNVQGRILAGRARHGQRFITQHVSNHPGVPLNEPIRTITTKDQWAAVRGQHYRPLTIRENLAAMGFPPGFKWPACTRRRAITGIGNAVTPPLGRKVIERVADIV